MDERAVHHAVVVETEIGVGDVVADLVMRDLNGRLAPALPTINKGV